MTKKILKAKIKMAINAANLASRLCDDILNKCFPEDAMDDGLFNIVNGIQDCEMTDVDEIMEKLEEDGYLEDMEDGDNEPVIPEIDVSSTMDVEARVPVDGGRLYVGTARSDTGTNQVYIIYEINGYLVDVALAEVMRGELAEASGLPSDNKDVTVYLWEDPYQEDYTKKATLKYEDLNSATEES